MYTIAINLNNNSKLPLYLQLYEHIKNEITNGNLKANDKLPSKRKLSKHLEVSLNTIESAYEQLIAEGYIISIAKKGYFVSKLDGVLKIDLPKKQNKKNIQSQSFSYKYEFLSSRVDLDSFPYTIWRKITKDLINEDNRFLLQIGHSQGDKNLRECICTYLKFSRGVNSTANNIVIGAGTEYLFQVLINLLGPKNIYGVENPGYFKIRKILKNHNITPIGIDVDDLGLNVDSLVKSYANIIHITPSHQFPLGIVMPISRRIQLLAWANQSKNRFIIEDDYDSEFRFEGKPIPSLQSLDTNKKVIYMGTFSKCLAPSLRIGYMVLPDELMDLYRKYFSFHTCTVSRIEQQTLFHFINQGYFERHLNKMRNLYRKKRELLVSLIKEHLNNCEIIGTNAGLHLLVKVQNGMTEKDLILAARNNGIKVLGLSTSYLNGFYKSNNIISLGYASLSFDDLKKAILLLKKAWY